MKVGVLDSVIGGRDDLDRFERARSIGCAGIEVMLLKRHLRDAQKPAGLRAAQVAMIDGKKYSAPFYWAPFVLVGEWK